MNFMCSSFFLLKLNCLILPQLNFVLILFSRVSSPFNRFSESIAIIPYIINLPSKENIFQKKKIEKPRWSWTTRSAINFDSSRNRRRYRCIQRVTINPSLYYTCFQLYMPILIFIPLPARPMDSSKEESQGNGMQGTPHIDRWSSR